MTSLIPPRVALVAGATGLVGRALLPLLLDSPRYETVHLLLRRPADDLPDHDKIEEHVVDFARLPPLPPVDDVFVALGTTIKVAGSEEAFRRVDFDAVLHTVRAAQAAGARRAVIVSALGADANSRVFYNRVKGEVQQAVAKLGLDTVAFMQPSLLVGDREALGQPPRRAEALALKVFSPLMPLVPRRVRPIEASAVARAMVRAAVDLPPGVHVVRSGEMQG